MQATQRRLNRAKGFICNFQDRRGLSDAVRNSARFMGRNTVTVMLSGMACSSAWAAQGDVITPYVSYAVQSDSNIRRLPNSSQAELALGTQKMSDTWQVATGGIRLDKTLGRQVLTADASLNRTKYSEFSQFDHTNRDFKGNWNWVLGNHLEGNLGTIYSRNLSIFTEYQSLAPDPLNVEENINTRRRDFADFAWTLHPRWVVRGAAFRASNDYSSTSQSVNNGALTGVEAGVDYVSPTKSMVGLQVRNLKGNYDSRQQIGSVLVDNDYEQNEANAKVLWQYSEKSKVQFLGGYSKRTYGNGPQRNDSGLSARVVGDWQATSKLLFTLTGWREIGASNELAGNFGFVNGARLQTRWDTTAKVKVIGDLRHEKRDIRGTDNGIDAITGSRNDKYSNASLVFVYLATYRTTLLAIFNQYNQGSTNPGYEYHGKSAQLSMRYEF